MHWECGIGDCDAAFEDAESAIVHQVNEHERHECKVCGTIIPDGYVAIRHVLTDHSRAEYVRAYGASSRDVRHRERLLEEIESNVDVTALSSELTK
ncbi:DUF7565 family protein [Natronobeatus ordinarius]|uniref:DUF7565 family protein n=1 Tax=Natronobeatus ordinarius TaxID=2963433 RepID=UPI0020CC67C3|nr:hypothetical protein [Natronobeatus ordinarius]